MSQHRSPFTHRRYPLTMVCSTYRVARATVYAQASRAAVPPPRAKRGPKTPVDDETLLAAMRQVLAASPFHGEGHRKVRVRLRALGHRVGRNRVLRLMRTAGLLAPQRAGHPHGDPAHAGTITTTRPNIMWGTDATRFYTARDGWYWWFGTIDHASDDVVGWHVAKIGDRWAALEPIRAGARLAFGAFAKEVGRGLTVRSDWGPQYIADAFGNELAWLGIARQSRRDLRRIGQVRRNHNSVADSYACGRWRPRARGGLCNAVRDEDKRHNPK
jgi:putative transposase